MLSQKEIREGENFRNPAFSALRLATLNSQTFNDADFLPVEYDTIVEQSVFIPANINDNSLTVNRSGMYRIEFGLDAGFNGQEELGLVALINGVPYSVNPTAIQGRGNNKPVSTYWGTVARLNKGDKIQLGAKNMDSGNVTVQMRRLHFEIKAKYNY